MLVVGDLDRSQVGPFGIVCGPFEGLDRRFELGEESLGVLTLELVGNHGCCFARADLPDRVA